MGRQHLRVKIGRPIYAVIDSNRKRCRRFASYGVFYHFTPAATPSMHMVLGMKLSKFDATISESRSESYPEVIATTRITPATTS